MKQHTLTFALGFFIALATANRWMWLTPACPWAA
jgi:hypothetical protein